MGQKLQFSLWHLLLRNLIFRTHPSQRKLAKRSLQRVLGGQKFSVWVRWSVQISEIHHRPWSLIMREWPASFANAKKCCCCLALDLHKLYSQNINILRHLFLALWPVFLNFLSNSEWAHKGLLLFYWETIFDDIQRSFLSIYS